ncbi:chloride channel protein, CIC family [Arboricoccus pini]|uniref:Chloride channel protein, CIC family n=1 Tax=Arboricoccus pini TaxID=1963835 RepID=A0A212QQF7_9PROT|nr:chloride channel protein [Arboricoccus pini]SNB61513.1 chloride channel protein, CIC family [Arboricoccus pini]
MRTAQAFLPARSRIRAWLRLRRPRGLDVVNTLIAGLIGAGIGSVVLLLSRLARLSQKLLLGIVFHNRDALDVTLELMRFAPGFLVGALACGVGFWLASRFARDVVDVIEANALHGGNIPFRSSLAFALLSALAVGTGASVGQEGGSTQLAGALASWVANLIKLDRRTRRVFVAAGAAAAITALFDAPIAGTLYALELVLGGYAVRAAPIVGAAAAGSALATGLLGGENQPFAAMPASVGPINFIAALPLGLLAAIAGIAMMQATPLVENSLRRLRIPAWLRPLAISALLIPLLFMVPAAAGSGHRTLTFLLNVDLPVSVVLGLFLAKSIATALSLGAGFKGGMFSASLFVGGCLGGLFAHLAPHLLPSATAPDGVAMVVIGMAAMAASVIGAPFAIVALAIETTGNLDLAPMAIIGVAIASTVTTMFFGYNFATWRFHLRGLSVRGPYDVGRLAAHHVQDIVDGSITRLHVDADLAAMTEATGRPSGLIAVLDRQGRPLNLIHRQALRMALEAAPERLEATGLLAGEPPPSIETTAPLNAFVRMLDRTNSHLAMVVDPLSGSFIGLAREEDALKRLLATMEAIRQDDLGPAPAARPERA